MRTLTKSRIFVVSLNALVLAAFAMWIWCEVAIYLGENPMVEMFVLIVIIPALLVFGGILLVLGRRFHVPLLNRLIPFIGLVWFFLGVFLYGLPWFFSSLNQYLLNACIVVAPSILTIATTVSIVRSKQNGSQTGKVRWLPKEDRMSRKQWVGIVAASIIVVIVVLVISLSEYGSVGGFPDRNLGRAIRAALNQTSGAIDISELAGLTTLEAEAKGIKDLSGLDHYCTNLTRLVLRGNEISDISPLVNLTSLTYLSLGSNQITDVSPIATLVDLTYLDLGGNQITDISPLANLTNLAELYLYDNQISDIGALTQNAGLGTGDQIELQGNPLSSDSINIYIPQLEARGVSVSR